MPEESQLEALSPLAQYLWVAAGALVTAIMGLAILYWIDQEWRRLDRMGERAGDLPSQSSSRSSDRAGSQDSEDQAR